MKIYLIRHGETQFNQEQRYQGSLDVPLSEEGGRKLTAAEFCPDVVYTSHMRRTMETAHLIFPGAQLIPVRDLREMSFGVYEGRSKADLAGDPEYETWLASGFVDTCPGAAEDHDTFVRRTCEAFAALVDDGVRRGMENLVIVAHGGTQMAVLSSFADERRAFGRWLTGNGAGYVLETARWQGERLLTVKKEIRYSV